MADFCLVARRVLTEFEYKVFRYTFVLGADWNLCSRRLQLDRGNYFHYVYRIEEKLGREFADLEPYPLYPVDEYIGGAVRAKKLPKFPPYRVRRNTAEDGLPMTA